jgi:hypothetical protein
MGAGDNRKSYEQPPAASRQRYPASSSKHWDINQARHYRSDDSSYHAGYTSRDEALWDMSDCKGALQGAHSAGRRELRPTKKGAYPKKGKSVRYGESSDDSDLDDRAPRRRSLATSPIRRALGKPNEWLGVPSVPISTVQK